MVVYFYPKDFTSGCTKEACSFRDMRKDLGKLGAQVIGISKGHAGVARQVRRQVRAGVSRC